MHTCSAASEYEEHLRCSQHWSEAQPHRFLFSGGPSQPLLQPQSRAQHRPDFAHPQWSTKTQPRAGRRWVNVGPELQHLPGWDVVDGHHGLVTAAPHRERLDHQRNEGNVRVARQQSGHIDPTNTSSGGRGVDKGEAEAAMEILSNAERDRT